MQTTCSKDSPLGLLEVEVSHAFHVPFVQLDSDAEVFDETLELVNGHARQLGHRFLSERSPDRACALLEERCHLHDHLTTILLIAHTARVPGSLVNGDEQAPQRIFDGVQGLEGVDFAGEPQFNDEKTVAIVFVTPDSAPQDEANDLLVDRLRREVVPAATANGDAVAYVSGLTAAFKDIGDRIFERAPLFLLFIIGVTLIVLAMAFRSIVISATAAVTTILSAFVGFGVLTLVVQEGHLLGLTGLDQTGPIETFVPPITFAILFGLSMDYMVFLMSRIREEHVHGLETRAAVEHGISAIGRVVVAAALIMGTVFAAFILSADRIPKEFGLLLAVAILTDALIVRMTLVPAFLTLLGEKAWYIPRWLDRLLPNVTIEPPQDGQVAPRTHGVEHPAEAAGHS